MADNHACFVCFRSGKCDLKGAAKALARVKLMVNDEHDQLVVGKPGKPQLRISYNSDDYVAEENAEIAQRNQHAAGLLPCEARFEVSIDDLDATLDEYDTLFTVQVTLAEATGGFVFNTWNGGFPPVWPES